MDNEHAKKLAAALNRVGVALEQIAEDMVKPEPSQGVGLKETLRGEPAAFYFWEVAEHITEESDIDLGQCFLCGNGGSFLPLIDYRTGVVHASGHRDCVDQVETDFDSPFWEATPADLAGEHVKFRYKPDGKHDRHLKWCIQALRGLGCAKDLVEGRTLRWCQDAMARALPPRPNPDEALAFIKSQLS